MFVAETYNETEVAEKIKDFVDNCTPDELCAVFNSTKQTKCCRYTGTEYVVSPTVSVYGTVFEVRVTDFCMPVANDDPDAAGVEYGYIDVELYYNNVSCIQTGGYIQNHTFAFIPLTIESVGHFYPLMKLLGYSTDSIFYEAECATVVNEVHAAITPTINYIISKNRQNAA